MAKNIGNIVGSASSDPRIAGVVTTSNSSIWTKQEHFYYAKKGSWPKQIKTFIVELWGARGLNGGCSGANGGYNKSEISSFEGTSFSLIVSNGTPGFNAGGPSQAGAGGGSTGIAVGGFPSPKEVYTANWLAVAGGGGGGGSGPWTCSPGSAGSGSGGTGPASDGGQGPTGGQSGKGGGGGAGVPGGGSGGVGGNNADGGFGGGGGSGGVRSNASSVSIFVNSVTLLDSSDGSYSGLGSARITYNGVTSSFSAGVSTNFTLW